MRSLLCLLSLIAICATIKAQWVQTSGPEGGSTYLLSIEDTLFAGTWDGLYRSTNSGDNWTRMAFHHQRVYLHPRVKDLLFVTTYDDQSLYRSSDNGRTWERAATLFIAGAPMSISHYGDTLFSMGSPNQLPQYFSGDDTAYFYYYYSIDKGNSWIKEKLAHKIHFSAFESPYFDWELANANGMLFVIRRFGQVVVRTDGDWLAIASINGVVTSIVSVGNILFASVHGGLLRSDDFGKTWTNIPEVRASRITASNGTLFVNLYTENKLIDSNSVAYSIDTGRTWQPVVPLSEATSIVELAITSKGYCYSTNTGLARCDKGYSRAREINSGLVASNAGSVSTIGDELFAVSENVLYRSTDNGDSWEKFYDQYLLEPAEIVKIRSTYIIRVPNSYKTGQLLKTDNDGVSWWRITTPAHLADSVIDIATSGNRLYLLSYQQGVYFSDDTGSTWQPVENQITGTDLGLYADDSLLAVGGSLSWDGGRTWSDEKIWPSTGSGPILLSGNTDRIMRSSDWGHTWDTVWKGGESAHSMHFLTISGSNAIASLNRQYSHKYYMYSHDGGLTWDSVAANLGSQLAVSSKYFFVGSQGMGVWRVPFQYVSVDRNDSKIGVRGQIGITSIYPNPAQDEVTVAIMSAGKEAVTVEVYDAVGKLVQASRAEPGTIVLPVSRLSSGSYVLRVMSGGEVVSRGFVVER